MDTDSTIGEIQLDSLKQMLNSNNINDITLGIEIYKCLSPQDMAYIVYNMNIGDVVKLHHTLKESKLDK